MKQKQNQKDQKKEKSFYEHKPKREFKASLSKDGKYWIFKDITTNIIPRGYISKIELDFFKKQGSETNSEVVDLPSKMEQRNAASN